MRRNKNYLALTSCLITLAVVVWFSTSNCGGGTVEIKPEIFVSEQRTDAARAIDAYERIIDRYMNMTERNFGGIGSDFQAVFVKLDSIDAKLRTLSNRMAKIERAMGIKQPQKKIKKKIVKTEGKLSGEPNSQNQK